MAIRLDPLIDQDPSTLTEPPYYGWGSSNQLCRTRIPALNLEAGFAGANQQQEFYVEDLTEPVANLQQEITIIQGDVVTINNNIININNDITDIDADLTIIEGKVAALEAIPPVTVGAPIPNAPNGATISPTNVLQLGFADQDSVGIVSNVSQTFSGTKNFQDKVTCENTGGALAVLGDIYMGRTLNTIEGVFKQAFTWLHNYSSIGAQETNVFLGNQAGNFTNASIQNVGIGAENSGGLTSGSANVHIGPLTGNNVTTGNSNVLIGNQAGFNVTTGNENIIIGGASGSNILNGNANIVLNGAPPNGSGQIVLGKTGTHTSCNIAGIGGVAAGGTPEMVVIDPATNKLGSQAVPAVGVNALSAIGSVPNANGATITGNVLNLQKADTGFGGVISIDAQGFTGEKTFLTGIKFASAGAVVSENLNFYEIANQTTGIEMLSGPINAMLIRGLAASPATFTIQLTRLGNIVFIKIPAFKVTSYSGTTGTCLLSTVIPARFRPTFNLRENGSDWQQSTTNSDRAQVIISSGGQIDFIRPAGGNWQTDFGPPQDFCIEYTI